MPPRFHLPHSWPSAPSPANPDGIGWDTVLPDNALGELLLFCAAARGWFSSPGPETTSASSPAPNPDPDPDPDPDTLPSTAPVVTEETPLYPLDILDVLAVAAESLDALTVDWGDGTPPAHLDFVAGDALDYDFCHAYCRDGFFETVLHLRYRHGREEFLRCWIKVRPATGELEILLPSA